MTDRQDRKLDLGCTDKPTNFYLKQYDFEHNT